MTRPKRPMLPAWLLAGWLFADLLLVLFVVSLSTASPGSPKVKASISASPKPTPKPTNQAFPFGLDPHSHTIRLRIVDYSVLFTQGTRGKAAHRIVQRVDRGLSAVPDGRRPVGFVIISGEAPENPVGINDGIHVAGMVARILHIYQPQFKHAVPDREWKYAGAEGEILIKIFFDNVK